jgi:hypothetical protein
VKTPTNPLEVPLSTDMPSSVELPSAELYSATPGGRKLETEEFKTDDYPDKLKWKLSFKHLARAPGSQNKGPVIMVPGAGVRANLFCPPLPSTLPGMLSQAGYDVWLMNWRASIDLPPIEYTLDDAAFYDFPAAVRHIRQRTGADKVKAVIHCQGSCAFMMSIAAGKLDDVSVVVANSAALHPLLPWTARHKLPLALKALGRNVKWFNPQWGISAPRFWPKVIDWVVRAFHHECGNAVCKHSSFVYGFGFPTLWSHDNLNEATHEWIKGEFAHVPRSLFNQLSRSQPGGRLVAARSFPDWPTEFALDAPKTNARFAFITGEDNQTFRPEAMKRTCEYFKTFQPDGGHTFRSFHGYGHLDMFLGKDAAHDVFPYIIEQLDIEPSQPPPVREPEPTAAEMSRNGSSIEHLSGRP